MKYLAMKYLAMFIGGIGLGMMVGFALGLTNCIMTQPPLDPMIERELNTCLTNNEALIGTASTLTAELEESTAWLNKTTGNLNECIALAQVLLEQVGVTNDDLLRVCPMWAKFATEPCPP